MTKKVLKYYFVLLFCLGVSSLIAQVKIGDNHKRINPASLLELESKEKGFMFTRVSLDNDLTIWKLTGGQPADGMVVFNTNTAINPEGLYCWYNNQWNFLSGGGTFSELDTLSFNVDTRILYDDGDSVTIPSGRVAVLDSLNMLQLFLDSGVVNEGDVYYINGNGLYIRNNFYNAKTVVEAFIFMPAIPKPGRIMYANYTSAVQIKHDTADFKIAVVDSFYKEPDNPAVIKVDPPDVAKNNGYYAFAVPSQWSNPRIYLKVKNSKDGGFYLLENCWNVTREMEYDGILYQIWTLDVPMRRSVMHDDLEFMIE